MTESNSDGRNRTDEPHPAGAVLSEILSHEWHRPVLLTLVGGAKRYVEIKAELLAAFDPAPGEGQINLTLRDLSRLGLVRKGPSMRDPWMLTGRGHGASQDLTKLFRLMAADPDSADEAGGTDAFRVDQSKTDFAARAAAFNPYIAHPARRYNYWLGGKDNFQADRDAGDELERLYPGMRAGVRANRDLLGRVVRCLSADYGIVQFLDIGTGLPTANNTHEIAQAIKPSSRVVYVDNDPLVLAHARALLTSSPHGRTAYIQADVREPHSIVASDGVRDTLDLSRPVALLLAGVLHFIPGRAAVKPLVDLLMSHLAPGSFLFISHVTNDFQSPEVVAAHEQKREKGGSDFWMRNKEEVVELFAGLDVLEPGIVPVSEWRPDSDTPALDLRVVNAWAGMARKVGP